MKNRKKSYLSDCVAAFVWEAKKARSRLAPAEIAVLVYLIVLAALPERYIGGNLPFLAGLFSAFLTAVMLIGSVLFPFLFMIFDYEDEWYELERVSDLPVSARLAAKTALCLLFCLGIYLMGWFGTFEMKKFATESVSWFHLNVDVRIPESLVIWGILHPLLLLWLFLYRLRLKGRKYYVSTYAFAYFGTGLIQEIARMGFFHFSPGTEIPLWVSGGVFYLTAGVFSVLFFLGCVKLEKHVEFL